MNAIKTYKDTRTGAVYADRYTKCLVDGTPYRFPVPPNEPTHRIKVGKNWLYLVSNAERLTKLQRVINDITLLDGVSL